MSSKWSHVRPSYHLPNHLPIPAKTGPLDSLAQKRVLVFADLENLLLGARQLGCVLSLHSMSAALRTIASECRLLGFISFRSEEQSLAGLLPTANDWEIVRNGGDFSSLESWSQLRNSDNLMLFRAGGLIERVACDVVVLGSGDGSLVCSLARFIRDVDPAKSCVTLSLSGSTSNRILANRNIHISSNVIVGFDCLKPIN